MMGSLVADVQGEIRPPRESPVLKVVLIAYLVLTIGLYNGFFPTDVSSRIALFGIACVCLPFLLPQFLSWTTETRLKIFSLGGFFLSLLGLEVVHSLLGAEKEYVSIVSILSVLSFIKMADTFSKNYLISVLSGAATVYILIFYPLAHVHGMVGVDAFSKGTFISQYIPTLDSYVLNGSYVSGRGTLGLMGAVLALIVISRIKVEGMSLVRVAQVALGLFSVLASDTRAVILAFGLALIPLLFATKGSKLSKGLLLIPLLSIVLTPVVISNVGDILSSTQFEIFTREGLGGAEGREMAWLVTTNLVLATPLTVLIGYGDAGAMSAMGNIFSTNHYGHETLLSAHNLTLQVLLDGGIVALIIFIGLVLRFTIRGLKRLGNASVSELDAAAVVAFLFMYGISASVIDTGRINETMFLFTIALVALARQLRETT